MVNKTLSISSEVSLYLPSDLATQKDGSRYFKAYICEKSKFSRKKYNIRYSIREEMRWYYRYCDGGEFNPDTDLEIITIKNGQFKLKLDEYSKCSTWSDKIKVRLIHPSFEKYDYPIYVEMRSGDFLNLIREAGYVSDGEVHGDYCLDFSISGGSEWRYCHFVLDNRSVSGVSMAKMIGDTMEKNTRVNINKWIPGHQYIMNSTTIALYLGKVSSFNIIERYGSQRERVMEIISPFFYIDRPCTNEKDAHLVYYIDGAEDLDRLKGLSSLSALLPEITAAYAYMQVERNKFHIFRGSKRNLGWEFGEVMRNDIDGIDLRTVIDNQIIAHLKDINSKTTSWSSYEVDKFIVSLVDKSLIPSDLKKDVVEKSFKKRISDMISQYNRNSSRMPKITSTSTVTDVLNSKDYYLRGIENWGINVFKFERARMEELTLDVIKSIVTP